MEPMEEDGQVTTTPRPQPSNIVLRTPKKTMKKKENKITGLDDFDKAAIRRHILAYYQRKQVPTLRRLAVTLKESNLFHGGISSLRKVILGLGFKYKKFNNRMVLVEKPSVALLRCRFLRKIHNVDIAKTIFLDETWLNENESKDTGWTDNTVQSTLGTPLGKGKRLIICHAGSVDGWIKAPPLVFESKKTGDYHEDMDSKVFEEWFFNTLLPAVPPGSTIVMDNAPYHSRVINKAPTSSSKKADMMMWLQDQNVPFSSDLKRPEIYHIVKLHKPPVPNYLIDEKAAEMGYKVIRLPPYHCHYNPIEMVWANLKRYVRARNTTFKIKDIKYLFLEAVGKFDSGEWKKCVEHVKHEMDNDWKLEGLDQQCVQQFVISLVPGDSAEDSSSSSDECSDDEQNLGVTPLV